MYEAAFAQAFCAAVKLHPAVASLVGALQWRVPETKEPVTMPVAVTFAREVQSIGVGMYCTGILEVKLEAQIDDETNGDTQAARAALLGVAISDTDTISATINAATPRLLKLSGYAVTGGGQGVDGRKWVSTILLRAGFAPAPPPA